MSSHQPPAYSRVLVSPRLTTEYLESLIDHEDFHHFPGTQVTVCCLTVKNGRAVLGTAICAEMGRFDYAAGKRISKQKALAQLMDYEQYLLRQRLHENRSGPCHE